MFTQKLWIVIQEILWNPIKANEFYRKYILYTIYTIHQIEWAMFIQNHQSFLNKIYVLYFSGIIIFIFRLSSSSFISNFQTITFKTTLFEKQFVVRLLVQLTLNHRIVCSFCMYNILRSSKTLPTFNNWFTYCLCDGFGRYL